MESHDFDLTVHQLQDVSVLAPGDSTPSSQALLEQAATLVAAVREEANWRSPRKPDVTVFHLTGKGIQYALEPPSAASSPTSYRNPIQARVWEDGVHLAEDEIWTLEGLEEFDHSCLHGLFAPHVPRNQSPVISASGICGTTGAIRERSEGSTPHKTGRPPKHACKADSPRASRRPRLEEGPLHDLLPEPHFLPSSTSFPMWPPFTGKDSFRATLTAIPPYTEATAQQHLDDPYGRLAWLIPVRGQLPWEGATPAVLVADLPETVDVPPQPPNHDLPGPPTIVWTRAALGNLWGFLQALRNAGNLGPLSIAFSPPPPQTAVDSRGSPATDDVRRPGAHQERADSPPSLAPQRRSHPPSARASAGSEAEARRDRLGRCAYLEVHHDARYTRALRGVLHSWHQRQDGVKVSPLRGAALVLLDERDRGLVLW